MALIIKCAECRKALKGDGPCACGSARRRYTVDYYPDGRYGHRRRTHLPPGIDLASAQDLDLQIRKAARNKKEIVVHADPGMRVDHLWPEYMSWYKMRRAASTYRDVDMTYHNNLSQTFGRLPVGSVKNAHIELYQKTRRAQQVSNRTINIALFSCVCTGWGCGYQKPNTCAGTISTKPTVAPG